MKVKIIGRKIYLPKELVEKASLPENGECEAILVGDEVMLRKENKERPSVVDLLRQKPITAPIDQIVRAQEQEHA